MVFWFYWLSFISSLIQLISYFLFILLFIKFVSLFKGLQIVLSLKMLIFCNSFSSLFFSIDYILFFIHASKLSTFSILLFWLFVFINLFITTSGNAYLFLIFLMLLSLLYFSFFLSDTFSNMSSFSFKFFLTFIILCKNVIPSRFFNNNILFFHFSCFSTKWSNKFVSHTSFSSLIIPLYFNLSNNLFLLNYVFNFSSLYGIYEFNLLSDLAWSKINPFSLLYFCVFVNWLLKTLS